MGAIKKYYEVTLLSNIEPPDTSASTNNPKRSLVNAKIIHLLLQCTTVDCGSSDLASAMWINLLIILKKNRYT